MSLQFEGIRCPKLEKALKEGGKLGIFRSGDTSKLSRLTVGNDLIVSELSNSIGVLINKTEWNLGDKLGTPPNYSGLPNSALDKYVEKGGTIGIDAKYDLLKGYLIDANMNIVKIKKSLGSISNLIQQLELEAIKFI